MGCKQRELPPAAPVGIGVQRLPARMGMGENRGAISNIPNIHHSYCDVIILPYLLTRQVTIPLT